jgi:outer membrane autotransporter protein
MWTLTGSGGQSWSVLGGTLFADGAFTGAVGVLDGAVLGGGGSVGALTAHPGGTVAPGNSIGTLEAATAMFDAGSLFEVEIDPLTSDRLIVTGTATISSDAMVKVLPMAGTYTDGFEYLILDASSGARVGEFGGIVESSAFLDFALDHDKNANQVWLTVLNVAAFPDVAETPNQIATAEALEALGPGNPIFDAILVLDEDEARNAFDLASGEVHATLAGALVDDSRFVREAVIDRLRQRFDTAFRPAALGYAAEEDGAAFPPSGPVVAAWANGFATAGAFAGDGNAAFDRRLGGAVGGVDWTLAEGWRFGLAGGLLASTLDAPDRASSAGIDTAHVAAYGGLGRDAFAVRFGGAYAWHQVATARDVAFPGFSDHLTASYGARTAQVFGEAGIPMEIGSVTVEPFAGLAHVHVSTDGFAESGGPAALSAPAGSASVTYSSLGARFATAFGDGRTRAHAMAAWQHAFGSLTPMTMPAFAGDDPFAIAGVPIARDAFRLELGVDHILRPGATASLLYSGMIASGVQDHGVKAKLSVGF